MNEFIRRVNSHKRLKVDFTDDIWNDVSDDAKELIEKMLIRKPERRPQIQEVNADKWFNILKQNTGMMGTIGIQKSMNTPKNLKLLCEGEILIKLRLFNVRAFFKKFLLYCMADMMRKTEKFEDEYLEFRKIDLNGDDELSFTDIYETYRFKHMAILNVEVGMIIFRCGVKNHNHLDFTEFLMAVLPKVKFQNPNIISSLFTRFDKEHKGYINFEDLEVTSRRKFGVRFSAKDCQTIINHYSTGLPERLTFKDFKEIILSYAN